MDKLLLRRPPTYAFVRSLSLFTSGGSTGAGTAPVRHSDPRFTLLGSSLLQVQLPPFSQLYTRPGQTLGQSAQARTKAVLPGPTSLLKPLIGRPAFLQEISTDTRAADILLAPRMPGALAVVGMDGAAGLFVRRGCWLARTRFLQVSAWKGIGGGGGFGALAFDSVTGKGTVVLNATGEIHRLVLGDAEEYLVDPRFVVAWADSLRVVPQDAPSTQQTSDHNPTAPTTGAVVVERAAPLVGSAPVVENRVSSLPPSPARSAQTVGESTMATPPGGEPGNALAARILAAAGAWAVLKATRTLAGVPDLYRVTGPGEIYVSTRLAPKPWTRITENIAAKSSAN
ncbi:mitochondrial biogenesis protein AIM24 [Kickxella alabastrina]|uniref:mitochondrial biogenesis protein AIM24 n=1 Tax=Kickxella alabastrina TaxID=61397 RepID=UPI0022203235|nr:mitochondrial biogenesis protein AIM24 [Kickxella alabastrina]KAI7830866.1 mitochondrial biogenesis protein AIM24 [Kickxella alabastrina]